MVDGESWREMGRQAPTYKWKWLLRALLRLVSVFYTFSLREILM